MDFWLCKLGVVSQIVQQLGFQFTILLPHADKLCKTNFLFSSEQKKIT